MEKQKKIDVWTIVNIVITIVLVPIIILNGVLIAKSITNPDELPDIFGFAPVVVLTGSMEPEIPTNSLIIINKNVDTSTLEVGDIITYTTGETLVTHRIYQLAESDGETVYVTMGDANNVIDRLPVSQDSVIGEYKVHFAGLGGVVMFVQTTTGMIVCISLPLIAYLAYSMFKKSKEDKAKREQLEEELKRLRGEE